MGVRGFKRKFLKIERRLGRKIVYDPQISYELPRSEGLSIFVFGCYVKFHESNMYSSAVCSTGAQFWTPVDIQIIFLLKLLHFIVYIRYIIIYNYVIYNIIIHTRLNEFRNFVMMFLE